MKSVRVGSRCPVQASNFHVCYLSNMNGFFASVLNSQRSASGLLITQYVVLSTYHSFTRRSHCKCQHFKTSARLDTFVQHTLVLPNPNAYASSSS